MKKTKQITIGDQQITATELSVREIDAMLQGLTSARPPHPVELLMDSTLPVDAVVLSTGIPANDLAGDYAPSELADIWDAVRETNDFLSRLLEKMIVAGQPEVAPAGTPEKTSGV